MIPFEGAECECGECRDCIRDINRSADLQHAETEQRWWREVGDVLLTRRNQTNKSNDERK